MDPEKEKVAMALLRLGITGAITIVNVGISRYEVIVDGEYFGIYDTNRVTFVD